MRVSSRTAHLVVPQLAEDHRFNGRKRDLDIVDPAQDRMF